ncbi:hypothetical protein L0Z36_26095 [Burkholderia multivorans]|nr:hypothetical protein [Burkholderia multivorans]UQP02891.1 hypothetical protein L0Z36_26095 [Burkholderia multivorans]
MGKKLDKATDAIQRVFSDQIDRTGHSADRIVAARKKNVSYAAIAVQMTENSHRNNPDAPETFNADEVKTIEKFHRANRTRAVFTKAQMNGLIELADGSTPTSGTGAPDGLLPTQ